MPLPWQRHHSLLLTIRQEWDKAEGDIKRAEQINDAICIPAIKELRYAGRRLVDAVAEISCGDVANQAEGYINDARLGCYRARHDALDAATAKIASEVDLAFKVFGHDVVLQCYPEFSRLYEILQHTRSQIAQSRDDRTRRMEIYQHLSDNYFLEMVERYSSFQSAATLMRGSSTTRRRQELRNNIFGYVGVIALILAVLFWLFPR